MKKVLSIFMAILMVVTMFSFSAVVFAEEPAEPGVETHEVTEKPAISLYIGNRENYGWKLDRQMNPETGKFEPVPVVDEKQGTAVSYCWNIGVFNPETPITSPPNLAAILPYVGTTIIEKVNGLAASGDYSAVKINVTADAIDVNAKFVGLKGTADCPIVITSYDTQKIFENTKDGFALTLADCENVVVENIRVSATNGGVVLEGCAAVTFSGVEFVYVAYISYDIGGEYEKATTEVPTEGPATRKNVYALKVGAGCKDITVNACDFALCRAGVLVDGTGLDAAAVPAGVKVVGGRFANINDAAVIVKNAKDVTVSDVVVGGSEATAVGTSIVDEKFDGEAAAFVLDNAENVTIERVYSTDNMAFINAKASTGRVRYNVSDRDGCSYVDSPELLIYNNSFVSATSFELDAVVKNNIFQMNTGGRISVTNGDNNCYHCTSMADIGSIIHDPWFANAFDGTVEGTSVRDNYILAEASPCLGEGEKVEDNMGDKDFYGNAAADSINIGADAYGTGAEATREIPNTVHTWSKWVTAIEPTETDDGFRVRICTVCEDVAETEVLPATGSGEEPSTGITITLTDENGKVIIKEIVSDYNTDISFENGTYTLTISKENYVSRTYTVTAADNMLSVDFSLNKIGDMNGDGKVNTVDVAKANAHAKGVNILTGYELACVDINSDGKVNTVDVAKINAHAKGVSTLW